MNIVLIYLIYISAILVPYLALTFKRINLRARLILASLFQLIFCYILDTILTNSTMLSGYLFSYGILVFTAIALNLILILLLWIMRGWKVK